MTWRFLIFLFATNCFAQTTVNGGRTETGPVDNSNATRTSPMKVGTSVPGTCTAGDVFFNTAATAGQNIYECAATNVFTQQLNSGSSSGGGISVYSANNLTVTANTYYFPIGGGGSSSTTETNVDIDSPAAATITNFYAQLSVALGMGNTGVFTLRKNATSQSVTCTITGASATTCNDTTHSFNVSQGDLLTVQLVTTGTIVVSPNVMFAMQFGNITASGTVNTGTINQIGFYNANGSAISGETLVGNGNYYGVLGTSYVATSETRGNAVFAGLTTADSVTFTLAATTTVQAEFEAQCSNNVPSGNQENQMQFIVDAVQVTATRQLQDFSVANLISSCSATYHATLASGAHTIAMQYATAGGTSTGTWALRRISVFGSP